MASSQERGWLAAFTKGSKALQQKLTAAHGKKPEFQAFMKKHGLENTSSVKQVSKSQVDKVKEKAREKLAAKAYGATKGTKMGGEQGSNQEVRDTTVPLSPEQHSKIKAAERAAKPAKPVKEKKPRAKKAPTENKPVDRMALLKQIASRKKINNPPVSHKQLRTIAAVGGQEHDHGGWDDLAGTGFEGRSGRNIDEEVETFKVGDKVKVHTPNDLDWHERKGELVSTSDNGHVVKLNGGAKLSVSKHQIKKIDEEVEQVNEVKMGIGTVVKLKKPIDGHGYATVKGFTSSGSTRGPTGRGVPMPAGNVKKVKVALRKSDDHSYYPGPVVDIHHDDVHSVVCEEVWDNPNPKKTSKALSASQKARAKARARAAGRSYPNLVDNMWASKLSEGMIDDFVASKIQAYHGAKVKGSVEQADKARTDLTAKLAPIKRKIERIKARASYKDKSHARHDETKLDLKHAKAEHDSIASERTKHYDAFKKAKAERDTNIQSDLKTYDKYGLVGLGLKRLKQNMQKEDTMKEGILSTLLGKKKELAKAKPAAKKPAYQGLPKEWSQEKRGNEYDANQYMARLKNEEYKEPFEGGKEPSKNKGIVAGKSRPEGMSRVAHLARLALKKKAAMKEEAEQIDELSNTLVRRYGGKAIRANLAARAKGDTATAYKRAKGVNLASAKAFPGQYKNSPDKAKVPATNEEAKASSVYALNPGMKEKLWAKHMADKKASSQAPADRAARMKARIAAAKSK